MPRLSIYIIGPISLSLSLMSCGLAPEHSENSNSRSTPCVENCASKDQDSGDADVEIEVGDEKSVDTGPVGLFSANLALDIKILDQPSGEISIKWTKATDDRDLKDGQLIYHIYYSISANINSIVDAEANGTALGSFDDIDYVSTTGLFLDKDHYFMVIVESPLKDKLGYKMTKLSVP